MESYIDLILANIESFEKNLSVFNSKFTTSELAVNPQEEDSPQEEGEQLAEIQIELFLQDVDNSAVEIVKLLCHSLLSGEYIYAEDIKKSLNLIEEKVKDFIKNTDYLPTDIQSKIFEYSSCVTIIIEGYKIFIQDISNKYSTERIEFLFSQNNQFENVIKESDLSGKLDSITDYFFYLIAITHIDHFPSNENEYITSLFDLEKKINNLKIHEYTDLTRNVLIKIKFLMHKWKERKVSENPKSHLYLLDGDIKTVENFKEENLKLKEWCEIIETQYELISKSWIHILESRVKPYKHKNLSDLKVLEIHQLIKYYKDVKPDYTKLNDIFIYLKNKADVNVNNYDIYANIIATNYSLNNSFSLFLELNKDLTIIKEKYSKVKDEIKGEINNFFVNILSGFTDFIDDIIGQMNVAGWGISIFSLLVGGFGIANIMFVSVKERTNLIGIQKALGAKNRFILFQFLFEAVILAMFGGLIGILLVWVIAMILTSALDFEFVLSTSNIILGSSLSIIIGLISGILPAISASKLDPVEAIRTGM